MTVLILRVDIYLTDEVMKAVRKVQPKLGCEIVWWSFYISRDDHFDCSIFKPRPLVSLDS